MFRKLYFLVSLFVLGIAFLVFGLHDAYDQFDFKRHSQAAVLVLAHPDKIPTIYHTGPDSNFLDVKYVSEAGEVPLGRILLGDGDAEELIHGGQIPVTYYKPRPLRRMKQFQEFKSPWPELVAGTAFFAVFLVGARLYRREAAARAN